MVYNGANDEYRSFMKLIWASEIKLTYINTKKHSTNSGYVLFYYKVHSNKKHPITRKLT